MTSLPSALLSKLKPDANGYGQAPHNVCPHPLATAPAAAVVTASLRILPCIVGVLFVLQPQPALAVLSGALSSTNSQIAQFIQGDIATLALLIGFCAAAWSMIVKRGQGFGWACIVFAVGVLLKNMTWLLDTITDLSGTLH